MSNTEIIAYYKPKIPTTGWGAIWHCLIAKRQDPDYWQGYLDWLGKRALTDASALDSYAEALLYDEA